MFPIKEKSKIMVKEEKKGSKKECFAEQQNFSALLKNLRIFIFFLKKKKPHTSKKKNEREIFFYLKSIVSNELYIYSLNDNLAYDRFRPRIRFPERVSCFTCAFAQSLYMYALTYLCPILSIQKTMNVIYRYKRALST